VPVKITPVDGYKRRLAGTVFAVDEDGVLYGRDERESCPWTPTNREAFVGKPQPGHRIDTGRPDVCLCGNDRFWLKGYVVVCPDCGREIFDAGTLLDD